MAVRKNKIAFFDDDPEAVEAYRRNFEWEGFEFVSADSPPSALKAYTEMLSDPPRFTVIDVIFKSFSSDKPNGFQLCRQLREIDPGGIFIVLTGMPDELTRIRLIDSKADCILEKPKTDVELLAVVKRIEREREEAAMPKTMKAPRSTDDYLKAIVLFVLAGLTVWCVSNRISDARWQGKVEGTLQSDQAHTQQLLKIMKDDVDMSWAYVFLLRDQMKESGLKPMPIPKRPNYSEELEK